jgi:hypothetical protein
MGDDDLRFGDVSGGGSGGGGIIDIIQSVFIIAVSLYVGLKMVEIILEVPSPFI